MKILVISLLRLGDLLMQKHLVLEMRKKFPEAEIHFLIYREFQSATQFLPEVNEFHYFERSEWASWINQVEVPLLKPMKELSALIQRLNSHGFDRVWNWTHQRASAYLMELIQAPVKVGLQTNRAQFSFGGSDSVKKFNDEFSLLNNQGPHYLEHLAQMFDLNTPQPVKTRKTLSPKKENLICLQPLTSDSKKNWGLHLFREWVSLHTVSRPQDQICVFGSASEREYLQQEFPTQLIKILSLSELETVLRNCDLLISMDTAVKHLGALCGAQILELSFGSAQPAKTGAWVEQCHVVTPTVNCWPCSHSSVCSQLTHACANELTADSLNQIVIGLIAGHVQGKLVKQINKKYNTVGSVLDSQS